MINPPPLNDEEKQIIEDKGTEKPFSGEYDDHWNTGRYICRKCGTPLYKSDDKFDSRCGWPSFDDEIPEAVKRTVDADGRRTEITCNKCNGHLGHVFEGEEKTPKNTRHCVNSLSLIFVPTKNESAIFASGCFWGTEYYFQKAEGVLSSSVGYIGGDSEDPSYEEVCAGKTGHREAIKLSYDPSKTNYEEMAKLFFETHDPEQTSGQGPDIGFQYTSAIYYNNEEQKEIAEKLKKILEEQGLKVATEILEATTFYPAEGYHQKYYEKNGKTPYCHKYTKRF